jgi:hypothetical protein
MSTRRRSRKNYLNESLEDLLEMNIFEDEDEPEEEPEEEEESGEEEELDLSGMDDDDEGGDDLDLDAAADSDDDFESLMNEPLESVLKAALKGMGDEEGGEEELDLDVAEEGVDEVYEMDELDEMDEMDEEEQQEMHAESRRRGQDLFLEIDENMLKKEITKMRRLREGEASDMVSHFGGGSLDKEMFVDVDDGDFNVHVGVLGCEDVLMPKVEVVFRKVVCSNCMLESKI